MTEIIVTNAELPVGFVERFWSKVDKSAPNGCWEWRAYINSRGTGYGQIGQNPLGERAAHRVAYVLTLGPIPEGLVLDHLCRNTRCVNPAHLEPVTMRTNTLRSPIALPALNAVKTHCHRGHEFTDANTHINPDGHRVCRRCAADWRAARRAQIGRTDRPPRTQAET